MLTEGRVYCVNLTVAGVGRKQPDLISIERKRSKVEANLGCAVKMENCVFDGKLSGDAVARSVAHRAGNNAVSRHGRRKRRSHVARQVNESACGQLAELGFELPCRVCQ